MPLQNCTNSEKVLVGPYGETCPASHDTSQAMNIKAEDVSDSQEEADPVRMTFQEIKAKPENCRNLENALVGPYGETCPTPNDAKQAMNVKAEAVSDAEEEEDPVPITFPEIKAEPEGNLNELQTIHSEEHQYSCDECRDSFSQEEILVAHQHIHSGEQPFCCIMCKKSFSQQSSLKAHQCIHRMLASFCIRCTKHSSLNNFASAELFLMCYHMLSVAASPELTLLHGPGICVAFCVSSPFKSWAAHEWVCKLQLSSEKCE
ncbi:zinc finger protein 271, partial [Cryptotermes secundus]|uniref:zinc finger protein 271 n=1 Tax=Cryptotermes secundus TaxID=105785 RepID=UPI000CD7B150